MATIHRGRTRVGSTRASSGRRARIAAALLGVGTVATGTLGLASPAADAASASGNVNIVAYSIPAPAYGALIRAFQHTKAGKNVSFTQSYGPSGTQAKAVLAGQPADIVNFATSTDMETLVAKNLVSSSWDANKVTKGMVTDSIVVFVVPKGNPKHITTWADLEKPGIRIFTPNPFSSGSARWNIMAAYGAELKLGKTTQQAQAFVKTMLQNTVVQGTSAATEYQSFIEDSASNKNDVFLDYEDDAIQAQRAGAPISYVVPKQTILIENPIAVTTKSANPTAANAFFSYLLSTAGQTEWAKLGYRPVLPAVAAKTRSKFPHPAQLFTIESLGGWDTIASQFFSTSTSSPGIITQIESSLGATT